jgi:hypothetical protein
MNSQEIMNLINQLGEKLSPITQQVWNICLKQIIVFGYIDLIFGLLILGIMIWTTNLLLIKDEDGDYKYLSDYNEEMTRLFSWIGEVVLLGWGLSLIIYGLMYILNPVYWVINNFANIVK